MAAGISTAHSVVEPSPLVRRIAGAIVILYAVVTIVPLVWIGLTSLKSPPDSISYPPKVMFEPTIEGFCNLFTTRTRQTPEYIASLPPRQLTPVVTRAMAELAPDVAVDRVEQLTNRLARSTGQHAAALTLFGVFSAVALLLSSVGLYGVLALSVAQRQREIGVRMALGATPAMMRRMILRYGLALGLMILATVVVGGLLAVRVPRNAVGWLVLATGALWSLEVLSEGYARYGVAGAPGAGRGATVAGRSLGFSSASVLTLVGLRRVSIGPPISVIVAGA